ncbi:hypothetical protein BAX97_06085 [Elizabethkingia meningoseptica]|uniref:hypothetical protein n=1 Tax=Elizabethkingia meningoseptica TaxID=238 RepID=UPI000332CCA6|nr:hypothetical protein [Elizabethkingia meningoseptica]AQX05590.1 hypothetical protein BBD33_10175 [Elizabethkingia meningoseptica]AQX47635.1 hypothetical protein B5G46_10165 [Elizabethkingia meningoseptica]EOR29613.1 hypothetical protein L100_10194 [Elizabethkingia meningoseptica ATCC 13253 = NBRC 12535]KUY24100.1 hypothetical protein ATB99_00945 [Elizabethkingia meningoseptica]OPB67698.1 hypothetical protein BAY30_09985 [Elizabethkingia meningoseptica]
MKIFLNNNKILLIIAANFLLLSSVKITTFLTHGFELDLKESTAYNIGLITGKIVTIGVFLYAAHFYYRRYLNLKYFP